MIVWKWGLFEQTTERKKVSQDRLDLNKGSKVKTQVKSSLSLARLFDVVLDLFWCKSDVYVNNNIVCYPILIYLNWFVCFIEPKLRSAYGLAQLRTLSKTDSWKLIPNCAPKCVMTLLFIPCKFVFYLGHLRGFVWNIRNCSAFCQ